MGECRKQHWAERKVELPQSWHPGLQLVSPLRLPVAEMALQSYPRLRQEDQAFVIPASTDYWMPVLAASELGHNLRQSSSVQLSSSPGEGLWVVGGHQCYGQLRNHPSHLFLHLEGGCRGPTVILLQCSLRGLTWELLNFHLILKILENLILMVKIVSRHCY